MPTAKACPRSGADPRPVSFGVTANLSGTGRDPRRPAGARAARRAAAPRPGVWRRRRQWLAVQERPALRWRVRRRRPGWRERSRARWARPLCRYVRVRFARVPSPAWRSALLGDPPGMVAPMVFCELTNGAVLGVCEGRHPRLPQAGDHRDRGSGETAPQQVVGAAVLEDAEEAGLLAPRARRGSRRGPPWRRASPPTAHHRRTAAEAIPRRRRRPRGSGRAPSRGTRPGRDRPERGHRLCGSR